MEKRIQLLLPVVSRPTPQNNVVASSRRLQTNAAFHRNDKCSISNSVITTYATIPITIARPWTINGRMLPLACTALLISSMP